MARRSITLDDKVANGGGDFIPVPKGWYSVEIDEVEEVEVKNGKNKGKEMYKYKLKVLEGDHQGRVFFVQACLWAEAIFTQRDIQAAVGLYTRGEKQFEIAETDELVGKELSIYVTIKDKYVKEGEEPELNEDGTPAKDNEVKKFRSLSASSTASTGKAAGVKKKFSL